MSFAVMRGPPTASQLYLDTILDAVRKENKSKERHEVNLAEIIYYCMKQKPDECCMVNALNGEKVTYGEILKYSVPVAQAIRAHNLAGGTIMFLMRNHQQMATVFYATLFADVIPLLLDANSTVFEINHFMQIVQPNMVFCDSDRYDDVFEAASCNSNLSIRIITADEYKKLQDFSQDYWNLTDFQISKASFDSTVLLIPTSGSSGTPKATVLAHNGLIAQLPSLWSNYDCFPCPTPRALLLSSAQWVTHTLLMITCPVYGVTLLMTPLKPNKDHILEIIENYCPTWSLIGPTFLKALATSCNPGQLNSLETVIVTGAPLTEDIINPRSLIFTRVKENLSPSVHVGNGMGTTETHSFISVPGRGTPWQSNGKIMNIFSYKIVSEDGTEMGVNQMGELYIKSNFCIFRGYYKNEEAYHEAVTTDGWYKTGDVFYRNENDEIYFVERKKFWFKYLNYHIAPEEVERVIASVPDVQECVVCDSANGPAAAVVLRSEQSPNVKDLIHHVVNTTLSDYKRLRGGVYIVPSLPHTHSGKLKRMECSKLIRSLTSKC